MTPKPPLALTVIDFKKRAIDLNFRNLEQFGTLSATNSKIWRLTFRLRAARLPGQGPGSKPSGDR